MAVHRDRIGCLAPGNTNTRRMLNHPNLHRLSVTFADEGKSFGSTDVTTSGADDPHDGRTPQESTSSEAKSSTRNTTSDAANLVRQRGGQFFKSLSPKR